MAAAICSSTVVHVDARATMNADWLPDEAPVRFVSGGSRCGYIGADVRPGLVADDEQAARLSRDRGLLADQTGHGPSCGSGALRAKMGLSHPLADLREIGILQFCAGCGEANVP